MDCCAPWFEVCTVKGRLTELTCTTRSKLNKRTRIRLTLTSHDRESPHVPLYNRCCRRRIRDEIPYAHVASGLADRGIRTGAIGIEETAKFVWTSAIAEAAPRARVVSGTPVTAGCRMIKDDHELELMQIASDATWKVYRAVYQ